MASNFKRALSVAAALAAGTMCSGAANANTYSLELFPLFGSMEIGAGTLTAAGTGFVTGGSITLTTPGVTFDLAGDFVTINASNKLTSLTGLDFNGVGKKSDTLLLAFLGGHFTDPSDRGDNTFFKITALLDPTLGSTATPLPTTWTMMLMGLLGLGLLICRGTKKISPAITAV